MIKRVILTGADMIQSDLSNNNFMDIKDDGVNYIPPTATELDDPTVNTFSCTCHPTEPLSGWVQAKIKLLRSTTEASPVYSRNVQLYGLRDDESGEVLIAESIGSTIDGTPTYDIINFDLISGGGAASVSRVNNAAASGYVYLSLPFRYQNYESITAYLPTIWDDFEDGTVDQWTQTGGTGAIESSTPINGTYSGRHTGDGTSSYSNNMIQADTNTNYTARFSFQLKTRDTDAGQEGYTLLFISRYVDSDNHNKLDCVHDTGTDTMLLRWRKRETGSSTTLQSVTWMDGKIPTGTSYQFEVIDTGTHVTVLVDDEMWLDTDYTTTNEATHKGFGCLYSNAGLWDDFQVCVPVEADELGDRALYTDENTQMRFAIPTGATTGQGWFNITEYDSTGYETPAITLGDEYWIRLSPRGVDYYDALRFIVTVECNSLYTLVFENAEFKYRI